MNHTLQTADGVNYQAQRPCRRMTTSVAYTPPRQAAASTNDNAADSMRSAATQGLLYNNQARHNRVVA